MQEIFIHPEYSSSTALPVNDIALLKLRHPARLTSSTGLVCLPQKNEVGLVAMEGRAAILGVAVMVGVDVMVTVVSRLSISHKNLDSVF